MSPFRWRCRLEWQPRDLWVGLYWRRRPGRLLELWVCLIPMLPLHLWRVGPAELTVERYVARRAAR